MANSPDMNASKNPVIAACKAGKVQTFLGVTTPSPQLARMLALSGFDGIMIDMEHGPIDIQTCFNMITALKGTPAMPFRSRGVERPCAGQAGPGCRSGRHRVSP